MIFFVEVRDVCNLRGDGVLLDHRFAILLDDLLHHLRNGLVLHDWGRGRAGALALRLCANDIVAGNIRQPRADPAPAEKEEAHSNVAAAASSATATHRCCDCVKCPRWEGKGPVSALSAKFLREERSNACVSDSATESWVKGLSHVLQILGLPEVLGEAMQRHACQHSACNIM